MCIKRLVKRDLCCWDRNADPRCEPVSRYDGCPNLKSCFFVRSLFTLLIIITISCTLAIGQNEKEAARFYLLGTRSWIRVNWNDVPGTDEYRLYWSTGNEKPEAPNAVVKAGESRFYIQNVQPETKYRIWLEMVVEGRIRHSFTGVATTQKKWTPDPLELKELQTNPGSNAVPKGMQVYWQDEFNDALLNRNKWFTNYYSNIDYLYKINFDQMKAGTLPQPAYVLNGKTINLFTNDSLPKEVYDVKNNKKYLPFKHTIGVPTKTY